MSEKRRRDNTLTIRVTKKEKERIQKNAAKANRNVTDYLVALSLETPIHVAEDVKPLLIELKRIGNNINQITAKFIPVLSPHITFRMLLTGRRKSMTPCLRL